MKHTVTSVRRCATAAAALWLGVVGGVAQAAPEGHGHSGHWAGHGGGGHAAAGFHGGGPQGGGHYAFHGNDVRRFGPADLQHWRGGYWRRNCFDGRCGWWWFAGGAWFFYDQPIYPYPLVVSGVDYVQPMVVQPMVAAPVVVAPVTPVAPVAPTRIAPAPKFWYYCDDPAGYYPAVANCNGAYRQVPNPPPGQ